MVALAGLFVALTADSDLRLFGWFLVVIGVLGMAYPFVVRALRR